MSAKSMPRLLSVLVLNALILGGASAWAWGSEATPVIRYVGPTPARGRLLGSTLIATLRGGSASSNLDGEVLVEEEDYSTWRVYSAAGRSLEASTDAIELIPAGALVRRSSRLFVRDRAGLHAVPGTARLGWASATGRCVVVRRHLPSPETTEEEGGNPPSLEAIQLPSGRRASLPWCTEHWAEGLTWTPDGRRMAATVLMSGSSRARQRQVAFMAAGPEDVPSDVPDFVIPDACAPAMSASRIAYVDSKTEVVRVLDADSLATIAVVKPVAPIETYPSSASLAWVTDDILAIGCATPGSDRPRVELWRLEELGSGMWSAPPTVWLAAGLLVLATAVGTALLVRRGRAAAA